MAADEMGSRCIFGCGGFFVLAARCAAAYLCGMDRRSNPADTPRPLPINNIRSPSAAPEGPGLQRINPDNRASAAGHRIASAIAEAAALQSGSAYTAEHRAAVAAAFEEARSWRRGAAAAATEEMQRDAALRYSQACTEREL